MSTTGDSSSTPPLPTSIWVLAWASLVGQAATLVGRGGHAENEVSLVGSILLGALLVGWVSAGVVRARTVRLVLAWVVLVLSGVLEAVGLVTGDDELPWALLLVSFVTTVVSLGALVRFRRTDWYRWQRTKPPTSQGASITGLVVIGVVVGVLGGVIGPSDNGVRMSVNS